MDLEFLRTTFGLINAPITVQRLMDEFQEVMKEDVVQLYLDDLIIFSRTEEEHKFLLKKRT